LLLVFNGDDHRAGEYQQQRRRTHRHSSVFQRKFQHWLGCNVCSNRRDFVLVGHRLLHRQRDYCNQLASSHVVARGSQNSARSGSANCGAGLRRDSLSRVCAAHAARPAAHFGIRRVVDFCASGCGSRGMRRWRRELRRLAYGYDQCQLCGRYELHRFQRQYHNRCANGAIGLATPRRRRKAAPTQRKS
jgi:hypothetical protein